MAGIKLTAKKYIKHLYGAQVWVALGTVLLITTLFFASSGQFAGWEVDLIRWIYGWPESLKTIFIAVSYLGSIWVAGAAFLYFLWRKRRKIVLELGLVSASSYGLATILKRVVGRPRPPELLSDITSRELYISHSAGFPSGHTTITSAIALIIMPLLPDKWRWAPLVWILLVGVSRIYLGVHAPLDIIGGFGLGLACAGFIRLSSQKLK